MLGLLQRRFSGLAILMAVPLLVAMLASVNLPPTQTARAGEPEPAPPADQEYTGAKRCASCHFEQYMKWKKDPHSKAFEKLTAKYEKDEKCLECHTTGYGEPTGFKDAETSKALAGVTCESCHGPGSKHEEICKPFAQTKELTPEQEKMLRDSIWMILPDNSCLKCHVQKAHKENPTPKELRTK
ncbi:MAG: hypothetical protein H8E44_12620 [Planctomycetes bacterium]|nr:hypothetical protein [Planctomycetota bacterium]MBL7042454.1 hypothetical protein [Pirellulaceae bacterium]